MKLIWKAAVGGAGALAAAWLFALSTPHWLTAKQESTIDVTDKALIEKGEYIAQAGLRGLSYGAGRQGVCGRARHADAARHDLFHKHHARQ